MQPQLEDLSPFRTSAVPDRQRDVELDVDRREAGGITSTSLIRAGFWTSFGALPVAAAAVAYATAPSRRSRRARSALAWAGTAFALGLVRWQLDGRFSEEPEHETEDRIGDLEVRRYAPVVVAETTVAGADWDEAQSSGFRQLADYISGKNSARAHIDLTPPVHTATSHASSGEKIAMTAPVGVAERAGGHTVTFFMPAGRTLESLPVPLDSRIQLRELPARRVAVLRFTGRYTAEPVRAKMHELTAKVARLGWHTEGDVHFGGYDPPWTLPFLRRNEVWVDLAHEAQELLARDTP